MSRAWGRERDNGPSSSRSPTHSRSRSPERKRSSDRDEAHRSSSDVNLCKVCLDRPVEIVLKPCKHASLCFRCSMELDDCPICRCEIEDRMQIFM